jgi:hypothetical protein
MPVTTNKLRRVSSIIFFFDFVMGRYTGKSKNGVAFSAGADPVQTGSVPTFPPIPGVKQGMFTFI